MLADALLRSLGGTTALLRMTSAAATQHQAEVGLLATSFANAVLSPVVMRKQRPTWRDGSTSQWEMLASASSVQQQVDALDLASAQSLFSMTLSMTVDEQDYLIDSVAANEAFGAVYLYRLLLHEAQPPAV